MTVFAFLFGAVCSGIAGYIGMWVSVRANVRVTSAARRSAREALQVSLSGNVHCLSCPNELSGTSLKWFLVEETLFIFNLGSDLMTFNHVTDCVAGWGTFSAYCCRHDSFGSSCTVCFVLCLSEG